MNAANAVNISSSLSLSLSLPPPSKSLSESEPSSCNLRNCNNLSSLYIPASLIEIGDSAFKAGNALDSITINENNPSFLSEGQFVYNKDKTKIIWASNNDTRSSLARAFSRTAFAYASTLSQEL